MAAMAAEPFEYTATGILGEPRETMLENQLLLRSKLAKPMTRGYTQYPGEAARYGRPNAIRDGGAGEALSGWPSSAGLYFHRKRDQSGKDTLPDRDFMALNRTAVQAGLTTAPQHYQFRATHDIRRKIQTDEGKQKNTRRLPPTMVYGISTRPSTPIHDLLEHKYQDRWLDERRSAEIAQRDTNQTQKMKPGKVYETRASLLRVHHVPVDSPPLWQLPKFTQKAHPHLDTFGSENAKSASFKAQKSDCISRRGTVGHGVYESAKN